MIKINNYIFNENDIKVIENDEDLLTIIFKDGSYRETQGTFEDIEWNYENNNEYCNVFYEDRIKELEEENKILKELNVCVGCDNNPDYKSRIDKAIEYIGSITDVKVRYFNYREFEKQGLHISNEELKKRIKEQKLEGFFIEVDRDDILDILKGGKNESN